jgi:hypothetical protein
MSAAHAAPGPQFIAYVYPGWHANAYRPGVDEWRLLDGFTPYFPGQPPPLQPLAGRYDDTCAATAAGQIALARRHGIAGFIYFTYFSGLDWVMDAPMRVALAAAPDAFAVAGSWCIRLPHDSFPVLPHEPLEASAQGDGGQLEDMPIAGLTLAALEQLIGADDPLWDSVVL